MLAATSSPIPAGITVTVAHFEADAENIAKKRFAIYNNSISPDEM